MEQEEAFGGCKGPYVKAGESKDVEGSEEKKSIGVP